MYTKLLTLVALSSLLIPPIYAAKNSTFNNPILPGWHSDPSCIFVPEEDNTFFCASSTFLVTPGIPIFASKDLVNWKLASHVLTRPSQFPSMNASSDQNDGIFAPTLRYNDGVFYVATVYVFRKPNARNPDGGVKGLIFSTEDPYSNEAWSEPVKYNATSIDPDLYWHENGNVYMTQAGISQMTIDLKTGATGPTYNVWNGTGGAYPEGPHIYHKDGYYYLLIGEGGTETNHSVTIARSKNVDGPYEGYEKNPILTAKGTKEYFQTVGHADLFQDKDGNWWAAALATRSGPKWVNYPMGREAVLTPATWKKNEWPSMQMVKGHMSSWPLPPKTRDVPGKGPFLGSSDVVDFAPGSKIPPHFSFWRWPVRDSYTVSPPRHPNSLRLRLSSEFSATPDNELAGADGISLIMRLQEHTFFTFSVDVSFTPKAVGEEVGVTVFLTQQQHLDLGLVMLPTNASSAGLQLRMCSTGRGRLEGSLPELKLAAIPKEWLQYPISLQIQARNDTHYTFSAASSRRREDVKVLGSLPAQIVSGDTGPFTGSLVGVYATSSGGNTTTDSYISRWRYRGDGQKLDN